VSGSAADPILTLEPFIDAVQEGVEHAGWELSGLQKTTSHQFEGRWEGDSTRSAYLFFHHPTADLPVSVDVYLDETTRGLRGNLALVVDLRRLSHLGDVQDQLQRLSDVANQGLPSGYRTPLTLRFRLRDGGRPASEAETEVRFKLKVPREALEAGPSAVSALASGVVKSFEVLLQQAELRDEMARD